MSAFTIPSIFTAVDKLTAPVKRMTGQMQSFAQKSEVGLARLDRRLNKLVPSFGQLGKQILAFASTAVLFSFLSSSAGAMMDYEKSIASVRTITGLTTDQFKPFENEIKSVAATTKKSSIDVAKSFELIASANSDLLNDPKALAAVSSAAITLAKAGGMSIEIASSSLTKSMNQFGVGADQAQSYIDILTTSQAKGTATISQLSDSLVEAGGVAKSFGLDLDETTALIQGYAKGGTIGAKAGTQLAAVLGKLSKVSNKEFNPVHTNAIDVIDNLSKANLSYVDLTKLMDAEGAKFITTLINQNGIVQQLAGNQNVLNSAQEAAATNTDTLQDKFSELNNAWINLITTNNSASGTLGIFKNLIVFVTDNLSTIVGVIAAVVGAFLALKTVVVLGKVALFAYNAIAKTVFLVNMIKYIAATQGLTFAQAALAIVQKSLNAVMLANPIGLVVIGIIALIAAVVALITYWDDLVNWVITSDNVFAKLIRVALFPAVALFKGISLTIGWVSDKFSELVEWVKTSDSGVATFVRGNLLFMKFIFDKIGEAITWVIDLFSDFWGWIEKVSTVAFAPIMALIDKFSSATQSELGFEGEQTITKELINPKATEQEALRETINSTTSNVNLNVNDPKGRTSIETDGAVPGVNLSSTMGF